MSKIIFYGDSNTYGYDPRGFLGMRYSEEVRWTSKIRDHFRDKYTIIEKPNSGSDHSKSMIIDGSPTKAMKVDLKPSIIEEGQNGRLLPTLPREIDFLRQLTGNLVEGDIFFVMLGTNDILLTDHPDADRAIRKMERLVEWFMSEAPAYTPVIIGPVPIAGRSADMQIYHEESLRMNAGFKTICEGYGIDYHDAAEWGISLAYDGVHFSEEGCNSFAERMIDIIFEIYSNDLVVEG